MMTEKGFSVENNQNKENNERATEVKEAEIEDIVGIISVLKENLLPSEFLNKETRDLYLKNTGKKIEDFSTKGFLVHSFSEEELKDIILDKENHITLIAKENDDIVGYAMTYNLENWRKCKPNWEKTVDLIDEEKTSFLKKKRYYILDILQPNDFLKTKALEQYLNIKSFLKRNKKATKKLLGKPLNIQLKIQHPLIFIRKSVLKK